MRINRKERTQRYYNAKNNKFKGVPCFLGALGCSTSLRLRVQLFFCFIPLFAFSQTSQDSLLLNKDFQFTDGLYEDVAQLRTNQPAVLLEHLGGSLVFMENSYLLKIEKLYPQGHPDKLYDLKEIEVISYRGLPFFRVDQDSTRGFTAFAGLRVRGRLSYFSYDRPYTDSVMIKAYNPVTGRPFREQKVSRPQIENISKVIHIETGEWFDFTLENMYLLLADDPSLVNTLKSLPPSEASEKIERFLLIYDDRNPLFLPRKSEN